MKRLASALLSLLFLNAAAAAPTDIARGVNDIRNRGCDSRPGITSRLKLSKDLDQVAREWARGGRLHDAIDRTDYRILNSSSMRVEGTNDPALIFATLKRGYCDLILNPAFTEIGVHQRDKHVWVVVAVPFTAPSTRDAEQVADRVLELVNGARRKDRKCGSKVYPAVPPLKRSRVLDSAALAHAQDMARNSLFEHEGSDGSQPAQRVSRAGYRWRAVGENIAVGPGDAEGVVQGWLDSPGHCSNIMSPRFSEMGVAYAVDKKSKGGIYWAQEFGTPR